MSVNKKAIVKLGDYFIVTSGYCEKGGLVSKTQEALLFLAEEENLFRPASIEEIEYYVDKHPILKM
ncbi:MAG: hypothetical protein HOH19_01270 [Kordiimonadaceae bacterium]|jgi:hypothetical protein|nr:hypothetical protein [Kordiimonadaceae bacterium]MBT6031177.1 hypothetical protein [Kordiimonadaceae bacterium]